MGDTSSGIRVFLLDDHEVVRRGLRELLEVDGDIEVVGEAGTAAEATAPHPGTAPGRRGPRRPAAGRLRHRGVPGHPRRRPRPSAALILTSYADDEALFDAIMAGAAGYVLKQIRGTDLVDAVRRVAAGQSLLDPPLTARVLDRLRNGPAQEPAAGRAHRAGAQASSTSSPRA